MEMKAKVVLAAGLGFVMGGMLAASYYEKDRYKSTIKVDKFGEVEDIHLSGLSKCHKSFIKKQLPEEMTAAKKLWEQHDDLKDGFTMIINRV